MQKTKKQRKGESIMTIKEVKEYYRGQYVECEIYRFTDFTHRVHSDFIYTPDDIENDQYNENEEVVYEELMDEEEYGRTVIANGDVTADFEDWFGDKNAQILVIILSEIRQDIGLLTKEQKS